MKTRKLLHASNRGKTIRLSLLLCIVPFFSGCRIVGGALALVGLGAFVAGAGVYQAVQLTGRAAIAAGAVTVVAVSEAGGTVVRGGQRTVEAGSDAVRAVGSSLFIGGDLKVAVPYDVPTCWNASYRSLYDMGFSNVDSEYDALSGRVSAETMEGKAVRIDLKQSTAGHTDMTIRVGVKGDREASEVIWQRIASALDLGHLY